MDSAPFFDSRDLAGDPEALRRRMDADGFLYLSRWVDADAVAALRETIVGLCRDAGWVDAAGAATGAPRLEGYPQWWEVYDPLQRSPRFHALAHRPELTGLVGALTGEEVLVHPRNIARVTFPDSDHFTTPAHQDHPLIQGTPQTYTAWIPLVDCPMALGGLAMLPGSHRLGLLPVQRATGPGGLTVDTAGSGLLWQAQDMGAGDILLFHSLTVHRALPNRSQRTLRLSVDYRYQGISGDVVWDSLEPHYNRLSWQQIYADWPDRSLCWYWHRQRLRVVPRDRSLTVVH